MHDSGRMSLGQAVGHLRREDSSFLRGTGPAFRRSQRVLPSTSSIAMYEVPSTGRCRRR